MPKIEVTDANLSIAAAQVRESMLSSLDSEEIAQNDFSARFLASIAELRMREKKMRIRRRIIRQCVAAIVSVAVGLPLFFAINTEARAAAISWIKETFPGQTAFYFLRDTDRTPPDYQLTWLPDGIEFVREAHTSLTRSRLYQDPEDAARGFTIQCGRMDSSSPLFIGHSGSECEIAPILINDMPGELYRSMSADISHCLVWFDDANGVVYGIVSYLDPDVIMHIAEGVKLVKPTK